MTFTIYRSKGFHISFPNGWTISVQFGIGNYCGDYPYDERDYNTPRRSEYWSSPNAEVAFWYLSNDIVGDPKGWQSATSVAELIHLLSNDPAPYYFGA